MQAWWQPLADSVALGRWLVGLGTVDGGLGHGGFCMFFVFLISIFAECKYSVNSFCLPSVFFLLSAKLYRVTALGNVRLPVPALSCALYRVGALGKAFAEYNRCFGECLGNSPKMVFPLVTYVLTCCF